MNQRTSSVPRYRPSMTREQLTAVTTTLREVINTTAIVPPELVAAYKILAKMAAIANSGLDCSISHTAAEKLTVEQRLGITGAETTLLTEAQKLDQLTLEERNNELAAYEQQLLKEMGVTTNEN